MTPQQIIRQKLDRKVCPFWASTAAGWIAKCMSGNRYFITDVRNITIRAKDGYVARFKCNATGVVPGSDEVVKGTITYTFHRDKGHKVRFIAA